MNAQNKISDALTVQELSALAAVLEAHYGLHAADMAEFLAAHHRACGDKGRSWAWVNVAEAVRVRERVRLTAPDYDA